MVGQDKSLYVLFHWLEFSQSWIFKRPQFWSLNKIDSAANANAGSTANAINNSAANATAGNTANAINGSAVNTTADSTANLRLELSFNYIY